MSSLGDLIHRTRIAKNISAREVSKKAGFSPCYMTKVETQGEVPSPAALYKICMALDLAYPVMVALAKKEKMNQVSALYDKRYTLKKAEPTALRLKKAKPTALRLKDFYGTQGNGE